MEKDMNPKEGPAPKRSNRADIYFNGKFLMETKTAAEFVENVRKKRRMNLIPSQVNIAHFPDFEEIRVNTTHGRVRRPLIIVEAGKSKLTDQIVDRMKEGKVDWNYLVQHGIIEYLDAEEEENTLIALTKDDIENDHTHVEIDPISMIGLSPNLR